MTPLPANWDVPLPREFYRRSASDVALDLLGRPLVRSSRAGIQSGWIVEVEAYHGREDPASHSYRGPTRRNRSMFGPAGHAYVYTIHTRYCVNVVTDEVDVPTAVLIRALEPLGGQPRMQQRRGRDRPTDLTRGPGCLCEALAIDRALDGWDLTRKQRLWIGQHRWSLAPHQIGRSPRIGISQARDRLLRFFIDGNPHVSGPRNVHRQPKWTLADHPNT